jgi:hypothetical protein
VTIVETVSIANVRGAHSLETSTARIGEEIAGQLALTNDGDWEASDVTVTFTTRSNARFANGEQTYVLTNTIARDGSWTPKYRISAIDNGTTSVSAAISYFDGNTTRTGTFANTTATLSFPFTVAFAQSPANISGRTWLSLNVTRVSTNLSITTTITLPPVAVVHNRSRNLDLDGTVLEDREFLNSTTAKAVYNLTYSLSAPPNEPLTITYRYTEPDHPTRTFTRSYPFTVETEEVPIIGFAAANLTANKEGTFSVTLIGNVSGQFVIRSNLLNETVPATANTYHLITPPAAVGSYPASVRFEWRDAYGREHTINGSLTLNVVEAPLTLATPEFNATNTTVNNETNNATSGNTGNDGGSVILTEPAKERRDALIWTLGGVVTGTLLGLLWILHRIRDPVRRVETLLRRTIEVRTALMHKRGGMTPEERVMLNDLEKQLDELKRELE